MERQRGNTPFPKLTKEARPAGNPTITPGFHCVDRARPLVGVMGVMAPRDLQCKDGTMTALLGCSGALLPPSFGRVADLGFERGDGGGGGRKRDAVSAQDMRERHLSGASYRSAPLHRLCIVTTLVKSSALKFMGRAALNKGGKRRSEEV